MSIFKTFTHENGDIRTIEIDFELWFLGDDIARALGYSDPQKALEDYANGNDNSSILCESITINGTPELLINDFGVHNLVRNSKLPNAKYFFKWVLSDVFSSVYNQEFHFRKELSHNIDFIIKILDKIIEQQAEIKELQQQIHFLQIKRDKAELLHNYLEIENLSQ